jgi:glycosyltransferase involved in cell wall biosynthesis
LVAALARSSAGVEWFLLGVPSDCTALPESPSVHLVRSRQLLGPRRVAWEQTVLPRLAAQLGLDLLHCPDFSRPLFSPVPVVNTIHDLSFFAPQPFFAPHKIQYKRTLARIAIRRGAALIADSEFTRREVLQRFAVDPDRVSVAYLGTERRSPPQPSASSRPFLLFVGTLEDRKNLATLVQAFFMLRSSGTLAHSLVLVGQPGRGWPRLRQQIRCHPHSDDIEVRGHVDDIELRRLYDSADVFVYPSWYEGFGLPVLEAMAAGLPVICSRSTSLPEVAGEAAAYFDPHDANELARLIQLVVDSPQRRQEMRWKGLRQAAQFTWEDCARRHLEIYQAVVGSATHLPARHVGVANVAE